MARPRGKCLSLTTWESQGQGVPFSSKLSLHLTPLWQVWTSKRNEGRSPQRRTHTPTQEDFRPHGGLSCTRCGMLLIDCLSVTWGFSSFTFPFRQQGEKITSLIPGKAIGQAGCSLSGIKASCGKINLGLL